MDYKYIEQLIERYWQCETTLQEEAILRAFFSQPDIPESLRQYQALFTNELQKEEPLGEDFDARILAQAPWEWGWDDPKDAYAKFHKEKGDSVNVLNTIQAENITDSLNSIKEAPVEKTTYIE